MIYIIEVRSDMGMSAIYLKEFIKYANEKKDKIYMTENNINRVCDWAEPLGIT